MTTDPQHITYFQELLREHELSITTFRIQLLKTFESAGLPLSAQQLMEKFQQKIDKVTLYRNVEAFERSGLICRMYFNGQEALYEERFSGHLYHHLICNHCGKIEQIDVCAVPPPQTESGFQVDHHHVEYYGLCFSCQQLMSQT